VKKNKNKLNKKMSQDQTISVKLMKIKEIENSILAKEKAEREKSKTKFDLKDLYSLNFRRSMTDYYPKKGKVNIPILKSKSNDHVADFLDLIDKIKNLIISDYKPIKKYFGLEKINDNAFTIKAIKK